MIGKQIKEQRTKAGLTQKQLAEKLFVTAQAVSRWESDEVEPSLDTVIKMADIFKISVDEMIGNEAPVPKKIIEKEYVYKAPEKPVLAVCVECNRAIYNPSEIIRKKGTQSHVYCLDCEIKRLTQEKERKIRRSLSCRKESFWVAGTVAVLAMACGIAAAIYTGYYLSILSVIIIAIMIFTFISCLILPNNWIGEVVITIVSWSVRKMPGLIFSLDLDGIIWFITVKLTLAILGFIISALVFLLAITVGAILSVFVYPFAIRKNILHPEIITK